MKALVLESNAALRLETNRPCPPPQAPHSVRVRVAACGVCGSDIPRAFEKKAYHYPLVLGHEFSAVVAEDDPGGRVKTGDRVAVFPLIPSSQCRAFQTGDYAQCRDYNYFGSRCDGGMEEELHVPVANLFPVPAQVRLLHAAMTEPAAVALHGVRRMHIRAGDVGLVLGAGPIGNLAAQWLRIHGCRTVLITDVDERKLAVAAAMGFETINSRQTDPVREILDRTDGEGAARVIEACGLPITFLQAIQAASRFGEVVFMGNIHGTFAIDEKDFTHILRKELTILGTWNSKVVPTGEDDWSTVLKFMDRELHVAPLITSTPTLDEGPEVLKSMAQRTVFHHKVIFKISEDA